MRPLGPSVALVTAVFLLGCQEQASGPVGPEVGILLNKPPPDDKFNHDHTGDENENASFSVTLQANCGASDCDVTGLGVLKGPHGKKKSLQQEFGVNVDLNLLSSFRDKVTDGDLCFPDGARTVSAQMIVSQEKPGTPNNANIQFFFDAKGTDGSTVTYVLQLLDGAINTTNAGTWPAVGGVSTITGGKFNLRHSNGPGSKVACTATDVALLFSIKVERLIS